MRVAVFGGSFNPPHVAHQMACLLVLETHPVDRMLVVPTFRHAFDKELAPYADRLEMCRLATAAFGDRVVVSDLEAQLARPDRPSFTIETLEALVQHQPGIEPRLVIGSDILPERDRWVRWPDIERLAPPIVVARAGHPVPAELGTAVEIPGVSSTEVRRRAARGDSLVPLVPSSVAAYIEQKGLYLAP